MISGMPMKDIAAKPSTVDSLNNELVAAGNDLAGNDDLLRSVLDGSGDCIKILGLDGRLQFMSEGGKRVMEVEDFSQLKGCPWPDFWADKGNAAAKEAVETARQGGVAHFRGAANTAKGTRAIGMCGSRRFSAATENLFISCRFHATSPRSGAPIRI